MGNDKIIFTPLEPAFLIKEFIFEDLPSNNSILAYIPVIVIELLGDDFLKVKTIQNNHLYLSHKSLVVKRNDIINVFDKFEKD